VIKLRWTVITNKNPLTLCFSGFSGDETIHTLTSLNHLGGFLLLIPYFRIHFTG